MCCCLEAFRCLQANLCACFHLISQVCFVLFFSGGFLFMYLNAKVTLSLPFPGTVHHRDISTKGAAVCLISSAQMGKQKSLGQPKVYGPSLTSIVHGDHCQLQAKVRLTINRNGKMIPTVPITYLLITPNDINKHITITKIQMQMARC